MIKFTDQLFKKLFMGLVTLAVMIGLILSVHLLFEVSLQSRTLWTGSIIAYLSINLIFDISGIKKKIIILVVSSIVLGIFFLTVLSWALVPSLITAMVILILIILLYMTFLQ